MMGWTISVGTAGARSKGRGGRPQALSVCIKVFPNADRTTLVDTGSIPAWQAQRVWQNVLSTLVGT
jgi:hypothetical protein